jgi:RNA polymerase sigma-70 factor, ECF subfamily
METPPSADNAARGHFSLERSPPGLHNDDSLVLMVPAGATAMDSPSAMPLDVHRFRPYLQMLARSQHGVAAHEASDLVQKTLLAAHTQRGQFRGATPAAMAAWLKQILRHQLIDSCRQQKRLKRDQGRNVPLDAAIETSFARAQAWAVIHSTPSQHVSQDEELLRMADALTQLPEAQREAIVLHHLKGSTLAEVAAELGRTEAAIAGLLHRGMKQLRILLDANSETS